MHLIAPEVRLVALHTGEAGYFHGVVEAVAPGAHYFYRLDGAKDRPDPASRFQPEGVHGPSQVLASDFLWEDQDWYGLSLRDYVIYELHVGSFTPEGTFATIIPHLEELMELGITALDGGDYSLPIYPPFVHGGRIWGSRSFPIFHQPLEPGISGWSTPGAPGGIRQV